MCARLFGIRFVNALVCLDKPAEACSSRHAVMFNSVHRKQAWCEWADWSSRCSSRNPGLAGQLGPAGAHREPHKDSPHAPAWLQWALTHSSLVIKGSSGCWGQGYGCDPPITTPFSPRKLEGRMERVEGGWLLWVDTRFFLCPSFSSPLSVSVAVQVSLSGQSFAPSFCFCSFHRHTHRHVYTHTLTHKTHIADKHPALIHHRLAFIG